MKSKKSISNIGFGIVGQAVTLILGVIIPRLYLVNFGSDVNGFLSTIQQLFVYVGLLEAGIGTISLHALYKPVAADNKKDISAVVAATHYHYKRTGLYYCSAVLLLSALYPLVVNTSELSWFTMAAVIFLHGLGGVTLYLFHGKYKILLQAEGKNYIVINLTTLTTVLTSAAKVILVIKGFDIIVIQVAYLLIQLIQLFYIQFYIGRHYGWLDLKTKPDFKAIRQKNSVLVHQVSGLVFNNTDSILLSAVCGLSLASVYAVYATVYGVIGTLLSTVCNGLMYKLGALYNQSRELFIRVYVLFEEFMLCLLIGLFGVLYILTSDFMALYTAGVQDADYTAPWLAALFACVFVLNNIRVPASHVIIIAGHFKSTQWRSVVETGINLAISLSLVYTLNIYGVLIGTVAALIYRSNDMILYVYRHIIGGRAIQVYLNIVKYLAILSLVLFAFKTLHPEGDSYGMIFLYGVVLAVLYFSVSAGIYLLQHRKRWKNNFHDFMILFHS